MKRLLTRSNRETGTVRELRLQVQRKQLEVKAAVAHPGTMVDAGLADVLKRLDALEYAVEHADRDAAPTSHMLSEWSHLARTQVIGAHSPTTWLGKLARHAVTRKDRFR